MEKASCRGWMYRSSGGRKEKGEDLQRCMREPRLPEQPHPHAPTYTSHNSQAKDLFLGQNLKEQLLLFVIK